MNYEEILSKASDVVVENNKQISYWINSYTKYHDNGNENFATTCWEQARHYEAMNDGIFKLLKAIERGNNYEY